jgi:hypothetical protein
MSVTTPLTRDPFQYLKCSAKTSVLIREERKQVVRKLFVTAGLVAASMLLVSPAVSAAPAQQKASCAEAHVNCWWQGVNFSGAGASFASFPAGTCVPGGSANSTRSYMFYGGQEGYFYTSTNCTGSGRAVT